MVTVNALVTAKSNSERVWMKNIKALSGKPLYKWTTDFLERYSFIFDNMYFSTDRPEIFDYNKQKIQTIIRPPVLCRDEVPHIQTVKHALSRMIRDGNRPDYIMLFQPTNPFRRIFYIVKAIKDATHNHDVDVVYSHYIDKNINPSYIKHAHLPMKVLKIKSGNFYLYKTAHLSESPGGLISNRSIEIPKFCGYNINTVEDFGVAETLRSYSNWSLK